MIPSVVIVERAPRARGWRAVAPLAEAAVRRAVAASAARVAATAARSIRRRPRRSAPGAPPATDTGELAREIASVIDADGPGASVESGAAHSRFLEFGTARMAARPFLRPALASQRAATRQRIAAAVRLAIARAARAAG